MSGQSFTRYARDRLQRGHIAVYETRGRRRYIYRRDGAWYRLSVEQTAYVAHEEQIGSFAAMNELDANYIDVCDACDVHAAVRVRARLGDDDEPVVAEWLAEARDLISRVEAGEAGREEVQAHVAAGHRLEDRVAEKLGERIRERVEEVVDALHRES